MPRKTCPKPQTSEDLGQKKEVTKTLDMGFGFGEIIFYLSHPQDHRKCSRKLKPREADVLENESRAIKAVALANSWTPEGCDQMRVTLYQKYALGPERIKVINAGVHPTLSLALISRSSL